LQGVNERSQSETVFPQISVVPLLEKRGFTGPGQRLSLRYWLNGPVKPKSEYQSGTQGSTGVCYIRLLGHPTSHLVSRGGLAWIEHPLLTRNPWLVHAFSTRRGGVSRGASAGLNLGLTKGEPQLGVRKNRDLFFRQLGTERFALASLWQVHSTVVYQVGHARGRELEYRLAGSQSASQSGLAQPEGDVLLTDQAGILLSVRTADCLPLLLADPKHRAVAAVHAGWRGALGRIIEKTVGEMRRVHGSSPSSLIAVLGPSIRACCYEVGEDVEEAFRGCFPNADEFFREPPGHPASRPQRYSLSFPNMQPPGHSADPRPSAHLDLIAVAKDQLQGAGLAPRHVASVDFCTACHPDLFYSYRRDGSGTGRMAAVIGVRPATLR
jgi:polyphenol oxidase